MLGFMLPRPTNHPKSAARSVWNRPVSGCKFPPEALESLIGDVGAWMWRNLLAASWSLCLHAHLGGWGGSCKGQSSTSTSQNNVACLESTYDMFPVLLLVLFLELLM